MKYKISKIRERSHMENGVSVMFIRTWYEVPELQFRGVIETPKEGFNANKIKAKIREEVKELTEMKKGGDIETEG